MWTENLHSLPHIGSHRRRHLCLPLTWCFGNCLTAVAARFVSRTASFPTTSGSPQCSDLAYLGQYAWGATGNENMQRGMRRYSRRCTFSFPMSCRGALTWVDAGCLTSCHLTFVSQIRVPKLEGVWGWCPGCPGRWGVAEILLPYAWLCEAGCPTVLDAPTAD